jgi:hypothetical protein
MASRRHAVGHSTGRMGTGILGLGLSLAVLHVSSAAQGQAAPSQAPALAAPAPSPAAPLQPVYVPAPPAAPPAPVQVQLTPNGLVAIPPVLRRPERPLPTALGVTGQVEEVGGMHAVVSIGASEGIGVGSHVRFEPETMVANEWSDLQVPEVVGEVEHVAGERALVALGLFESTGLREGQRVTVTADRVTASRVAPPRPPATLIVEGGVRPFLPLKRVSLGALANLSLTYLPSFPMFVRAELSPLAGRVGAGTDMGAYAGQLSAGYDQRFVAIGIGVGVLGFRDQELGAVSDASFSGTARYGELKPRLGFSQIVRVGARDGLHGYFRPTLALVGESWQLASLELAGQIPIGRRFALAPRFFVAAQLGVSTGELGLRTLVRGNGGHDSLFVRPLVGFAGSFSEGYNEADFEDEGALKGGRTLMYGPMVGIDLEYRL